MTRRRSLLLFAAILSLSLTGMAPNGVRALAPSLPDKLTDRTTGLSSRSSPNPMASSAPTTCCRTRSIFSTSSRELVARLEAQPRLPWRRPRAELHLHCRAQAEDGVHCRRPARQPAPAPDVQGALRDVQRTAPTSSSGCSPASGRTGSAPNRRPTRSSRPSSKAAPTRKRRDESLQAKPQAAAGSPDADASSAAHRRRSEGYRVRLRPVLLVRSRAVVLVDRRPRRRPRCAHLLGFDGGGRRQGAESQLSWRARRTSWC